jgi:hypothetical protein
LPEAIMIPQFLGSGSSVGDVLSRSILLLQVDAHSQMLPAKCPSPVLHVPKCRFGCGLGSVAAARRMYDQHRFADLCGHRIFAGQCSDGAVKDISILLKSKTERTQRGRKGK